MNRDWTDISRAWNLFPGITQLQMQGISKQIKRVKPILCQNRSQALMIALIYYSIKQRYMKNFSILIDQLKSYVQLSKNQNNGINNQSSVIQGGPLEERFKSILKMLQNNQQIDADDAIKCFFDSGCLLLLYYLYTYCTRLDNNHEQCFCKVFAVNLNIYFTMGNDKIEMTQYQTLRNMFSIDILSYKHNFFLVEPISSNIKSPMHSLNSPQNINSPSIKNPTISKFNQNQATDARYQPYANPMDPSRFGQTFNNNSSPVKNRDHPLYYHDQKQSPYKVQQNYCSTCNTVQSNLDNLFINEACGHGICVMCIQNQSFPNSEYINCLRKFCNKQIKMIQMENFFSKNRISEISKSIQTFTMECSYCQKSQKIDLDRKPEYYKCQFCNKNSCNLHEKTTQLEKCFCKCYKCLSDVKTNSKMKQCERCKISKCIMCNKIFQGLQTCSCGCQICNRPIQVINGKQEACTCIKDVCCFCFLSLDQNTISKSSIQCSHQSCHPCFVKQQSQRMKCLLCQQL